MSFNSLKRVSDADNVIMSLHPKQQYAFNQVMFKGITTLVYGGAVGGGKTVLMLMLLCCLCKVYPGSRWVVIRKDLPVIKRNVLPSFWRDCPKPFFSPKRFNKSEMVATAANGSQIIFMGEDIKGDPEGLRFDGLEINGALLEQAEEIQESTYLKLIDRIGRWKLDPMPPLLTLMTVNPTQNWVKIMFYLPHVNNTLTSDTDFIRALPADNPGLDAGYLAALEKLKTIAPKLYKKRVQGSWDAEDNVQQLISWDGIYKCEDELEFNDEPVYRAMGADVGRFGPDPSTIYVLEGNPTIGFNIIDYESYPVTSGPEMEHVIKKAINKWDISHSRCFVDAVGLGGFCVDHLHKDGYGVMEFKGGSSALDQHSLEMYMFKKLNDQVAWNAKEYIEAGKIGNLTEQKLQNDLTVYLYDIKGEKEIVVESKPDVKKRLKRSPDDGDGFKMALWGGIYDTIEPMPGIEFF